MKILMICLNMFYNASLSIYQYWINILLCSTEVKNMDLTQINITWNPKDMAILEKQKIRFLSYLWMGKMYFWSEVKLYLTPWI